VTRPGGGDLTYPQRGRTQWLGSADGTAPVGPAESAPTDGPAESGPEANGRWPAGYRRVQRRIRVGRGAEDYGRLARGILDWGIQRGAGLSIAERPDDAETSATGGSAMRIGGRVVCGFGLGPVRLPIPCEVVWLEKPAAVVVLPDGTTQPQRSGFGYGTLPGHPASGEEAFIASLRADGGVYFELLAFSKPAGLIFRLGSPVTTFAQSLVTQRYLQAAWNLAR
jgi:uncharacterized protein (UPF0548 family)